MKSYISFYERYTKLSRDIFPTIRSIGYTEEHGLNISPYIGLRVGGVFDGNVKLITFEDVAIAEIPLPFINYDINPHVVHNHDEFADLLNALQEKTTGHPGRNRLQTMKRIHWFQRVKPKAITLNKWT